MITKLLLYCTKSKKQLVKWEKYMCGENGKNDKFNSLNGKIVGECDYEVEEILYLTNEEDVLSQGCYRCRFEDKINCDNYNWNFNPEDYSDYYTERSDDNHIIYTSKLTATQLHNYLKGKNGYAIHIKNLHIFDEPKELNEVYSIHNVGGMLLTDKLKKAPQNMQRISIKEWEYESYNPDDIAILLSVKPQELCKILNGEKTIIIRKKVLKGML